MSLSSDLSEMVSAAMTEHDLSLRQMSALMGRSHNYVGLRLRGKALWELDDVGMIAQALGESPQAILRALDWSPATPDGQDGQAVKPLSAVPTDELVSEIVRRIPQDQRPSDAGRGV
jgi:cyanate lyase